MSWIFIQSCALMSLLHSFSSHSYFRSLSHTHTHSHSLTHTHVKNNRLYKLRKSTWSWRRWQGALHLVWRSRRLLQLNRGHRLLNWGNSLLNRGNRFFFIPSHDTRRAPYICSNGALIVIDRPEDTRYHTESWCLVFIRLVLKEMQLIYQQRNGGKFTYSDEVTCLLSKEVSKLNILCVSCIPVSISCSSHS